MIVGRPRQRISILVLGRDRYRLSALRGHRPNAPVPREGNAARVMGKPRTAMCDSGADFGLDISGRELDWARSIAVAHDNFRRAPGPNPRM